VFGVSTSHGIELGGSDERSRRRRARHRARVPLRRPERRPARQLRCRGWWRRRTPLAAVRLPTSPMTMVSSALGASFTGAGAVLGGSAGCSRSLSLARRSSSMRRRKGKGFRHGGFYNHTARRRAAPRSAGRLEHPHPAAAFEQASHAGHRQQHERSARRWRAAGRARAPHRPGRTSPPPRARTTPARSPRRRAGPHLVLHRSLSEPGRRVSAPRP